MDDVIYRKDAVREIIRTAKGYSSEVCDRG